VVPPLFSASFVVVCLRFSEKKKAQQWPNWHRASDTNLTAEASRDTNLTAEAKGG
jgi:hypothetical protein